MEDKPADTSGAGKLNPLLIVVGVPCVSVVLMLTVPRIDIVWDGLMMLGMIAASSMALLPILTARYAVNRRLNPSAATIASHLHKHLTYVVLIFVAVHTGGLLLYEPGLVDYLKLSGPPFMLSGIVATLVLIVTTILSLRRNRLGLKYRHWREMHGLLSILVIVLTLLHIVGSGYYFPATWAIIALTLLMGIPTWLNHRQVSDTADLVLMAAADRQSDVSQPELLSMRLATGIALTWCLIALAFAGLWLRLH